jgi:50S ribosomal protein L16 3-hydroxylase
MYFAQQEIHQLLGACTDATTPLLIKQPFASPLATEGSVLRALQRWAEDVREGRAVAPESEYIERRVLPEPEDETLDDCVARIERVWTRDWFAYINDVHRYDGDFWSRAVEILLPEITRVGALPAGGFKMELFFGKYRTTPSGIHLDSADNFAFIVRGPKRMLFWPPDRFQTRVYIPSPKAPTQQLALIRRYEDHLGDALVIEADAGDVIYWPKDYWHVGASPEGWTAMVTIAMWWNARPMALARYLLNSLIDLEGDARHHPFNPEAPLEQALVPPRSLREPMEQGAAQIAANLDAATRRLWARTVTSYGFTVPPARAAVPALTDDLCIRVIHPIVALPDDGGSLVVACGHQTWTAAAHLHAACLRLNAAPGAAYRVAALRDILGGDCGTTAEDGMRLIRELIASRALEVVAP